MADFDRDPKYMIKMRERVAHDILNAECAIDVEAAPTYENVNRRTVAVYAENGSDVVVDGKTVAGESRGAYSVYTATFDMNTLADRTEITVLVNGKEYTRVLKSVEESELMEEVPAPPFRPPRKNSNFPLLQRLSANCLKKTASNLTSIITWVRAAPVDGTGISDNREYAQDVWKCLALDINNTIPLAVMNEAGDLSDEPKAEYLTLYVPNGATVKVEGKDATFVEQTENYSVYSAKLDTTGYARYFYDVEVTLNGVTETWRRDRIRSERGDVPAYQYERGRPCRKTCRRAEKRGHGL